MGGGLFKRARRAVLVHRRALAAVCAALAVFTALRANASSPPRRDPVLVAAHDVGAGVVLRRTDVTTADYAPGTVPGDTLDFARAVGRTTSGALSAGEPVTAARLLGGSLLTAYPGLVAQPVRIGDAAAVRLLRVGDRIDILAASPDSHDPAVTVASDAPVVAVPRAAGQAADLTRGRLIVVAVPRAEANALATAGVSAYLSVLLTR